MKTIIAGSRGINDFAVVLDAIARAREDQEIKITEVVSGGALGVDRMGERYAAQVALPVKQFLPDYERHKRAAPLIRNHEMGQYADALIAIWDGMSRGTEHMISTARKRGLKVYVHLVGGFS